jgi:hypothetical protein
MEFEHPLLSRLLLKLNYSNFVTSLTGHDGTIIKENDL